MTNTNIRLVLLSHAR